MRRRNPQLSPSSLYSVQTIHNETPALVMAHACNRKQLLLAQIRFNRLIDEFFHVRAYSLQNHLRTTVPGMGQIETDEIYVAIRNTGEQFIVTVQAKGGSDQIGSVQVEQDLALCRQKFPHLTPRLVAVQFGQDDDGEIIVMFELAQSRGAIKVVEEKHYRLVSANEISIDELRHAAGR